MRTFFNVPTGEQARVVHAKVESFLADETLSVEASASLRVCANALRGAEAALSDLPGGVEWTSSSVSELTRLQDAGYAYVRP